MTSSLFNTVFAGAFLALLPLGSQAQAQDAAGPVPDGGAGAAGGAVDLAACAYDPVCELEGRLYAVRERVQGLARHGQELATRLDAAEVSAAQSAQIADDLRVTLGRVFTLMAQSHLSGPCAELTSSWQTDYELVLNLAGPGARVAAEEVQAYAASLPILILRVNVEEDESCGMTVAPGYGVALTDAGPRRAKRGELHNLADLPILPDSASCQGIGAGIDAAQDAALTEGLSPPGFWVRDAGSGGALLCARATSGAWGVRLITPLDTVALVVTKED